MFIKASTITNLSDARYFAAQFNVEWMGFCLDQGSSDHMPEHVIKALCEWVEGPKITGEFGLQDEATILDTISSIGLQAVQLPMFSRVSTTKIRTLVPLIQEVVVEKNADVGHLNTMLQAAGSNADIILLDFTKNGWSFSELLQQGEITPIWLNQICQQYQILISADFQPAEFQSLIETAAPLGLSIKGGEEERPGYKSYDELNAIFDIF
jgi:phosphoribosylanthranilate isomerase